MKRVLGLLLMSICVSFAVAQQNTNGMFSYVINLSDGDTFDAEAISAKNPYASLEQELAACSTNQIVENVLLRSIAGDHINSSLEQKIGGIIVRMKKDEAPIILVEQDSAYSAYYHKLAKNAAFRTFVQTRILDLMKETCRLYPGSYRLLLLAKIDSANVLLAEMSKHNYQIIDKKLYKDNILQADGTTLECWIARRILLDGVPTSEMKAFLKQARKVVGETYNPEKPSFVGIYTINEHLQCNVATNTASCIFLGKKSKTIIENVIAVQCLKDATGVYYQIRYRRIDLSGNFVEESTLYDSMGKVVY